MIQNRKGVKGNSVLFALKVNDEILSLGLMTKDNQRGSKVTFYTSIDFDLEGNLLDTNFDFLEIVKEGKTISELINLWLGKAKAFYSGTDYVFSTFSKAILVILESLNSEIEKVDENGYSLMYRAQSDIGKGLLGKAIKESIAPRYQSELPQSENTDTPTVSTSTRKSSTRRSTTSTPQ
jgi:hypothetical protein